MAAPSRKPSTPLIASLTASPGQFEFHQAVRLVELQGLSSGDGEPVGADAPPDRESVSFRVHPSLAHASAAIRTCREGDRGAGRNAEFDVTFAGLIGAAGVLPQQYSELVLARQTQRDSTLRDFLDVLHRRTIALFHRAWRKSHFPFAFELEVQQQVDHDQFTVALLSLVGLGGKTLQRRQAIDDLAFAHTGGAFANQVRSAAGLAGALSATFEVPFAVEQFVGSWMQIPSDEISALLKHREPPGERHYLGGGFTLGTRVWDVQSGIRLVAGPLTMEEFSFFADEAPGRLRVMGMARTYLGDANRVDLELVLAEGESPGVVLGSDQRLGANCWLEHRAQPPARRTARFALAAV